MPEFRDSAASLLDMSQHDGDSNSANHGRGISKRPRIDESPQMTRRLTVDTHLSEHVGSFGREMVQREYDIEAVEDFKNAEFRDSAAASATTTTPQPVNKRRKVTSTK